VPNPGGETGGVFVSIPLCRSLVQTIKPTGDSEWHYTVRGRDPLRAFPLWMGGCPHCPGDWSLQGLVSCLTVPCRVCVRSLFLSLFCPRVFFFFSGTGNRMREASAPQTPSKAVDPIHSEQAARDIYPTTAFSSVHHPPHLSIVPSVHLSHSLNTHPPVSPMLSSSNRTLVLNLNSWRTPNLSWIPYSVVPGQVL
jgi:hypothetical protein